MLRVLMAAIVLLWAGVCPAQENLLPNAGFEEFDGNGWPTGWSRYNWGAKGSEGTQEPDATVSRSGARSVAGVNVSNTARAGVYTHVPLEAGTYALSFWAKAAEGQTGLVRCYLATAYSRSHDVGDDWTRVEFRTRLQAPVERAEINIQNCSGVSGTVWFDDVSLVSVPDRPLEIVDDPRPLEQQPRLLYFSAHLMSWADHAEEWRQRGFSGAFVSGVFGDIHDDLWAVDGDADTRGEDDKLLQECRAANDKCRRAGIDSNVLKVAFCKDLPDPFDDEGYAAITRNFSEAARFARVAGFPAIAIDTEYTAYQFDPGWEGYDLERHSADKLATAFRARWRKIAAAMLQEYPALELMVLPEGSIHYGPLWNHLLAGLVEALAAAEHPLGVHVFCESSYTNRDPYALREHVADVMETTARGLTPEAREYWEQHGQVALGLWPLGYYRPIMDDNGEFVGWSGREEVFGNEIVGSYADKSENYPLGEFAVQHAAARTFGGRYLWVYGHGSSWWQFTSEMDAHYKAQSLQPYPSANYLVPTVANIAEYYEVAASRKVVAELE